LLAVSATGWFYGCGVQGSPHPPRVEIPTKINNLTAKQIGQSIEVKFTLPELATDGERLTNPLEIEILRATDPVGSGISKLPEPEVWKHQVRDEWVTHTYGNSFSYTVPMSGQEFHDWSGQTLTVGVRTLTRGFRRRSIVSETSNLVDVPIFDVSAPVQNLTALTTEKAIKLEFSAPGQSLSGGPMHNLAGFRIYRSSTGSPGTFEALADVIKPGYEDAKFEFGQTYYYEVRAEFGSPGHLAMSEPTAALKITPRDTFPPAPPESLSSIYTAGGAELVWTANSEADLAGYNVYRLDNQTAQRVNKELVKTPIFRDAGAQSGAPLIYYVTAVDVAGNESAPSKQEVVDTK